MKTKSDILSPAQAAEYLHIHPETLRRYEKQGLIEAEKTPGGHRRFSKQSLEDFRDSNNGERYLVDLEDIRARVYRMLPELGIDNSKIISADILKIEQVLSEIKEPVFVIPVNNDLGLQGTLFARYDDYGQKINFSFTPLSIQNLRKDLRYARSISAKPANSATEFINIHHQVRTIYLSYYIGYPLFNLLLPIIILLSLACLFYMRMINNSESNAEILSPVVFLGILIACLPLAVFTAGLYMFFFNKTIWENVKWLISSRKLLKKSYQKNVNYYAAN